MISYLFFFFKDDLYLNGKTSYCQAASILDRMFYLLVNLHFKRLISDKWDETPLANCSTLGSSWNVVLGITGARNHGRRFHVHLFFNIETKPAGKFHNFTARAHSVGERERKSDRPLFFPSFSPCSAVYCTTCVFPFKHVSVLGPIRHMLTLTGRTMNILV